MSEQNINPGSGTFDIFSDNGAFDLGSSAPDVDPFGGAENEAQAAQTDVPQAPAENQTEPSAAVPAAPAATPATVPATPAPAAAKPASQAAPENPLAAAVAQAEEKQVSVTAESLFAKAPVFEYGGASEDIADTSKTFEELRIEKSADFPELDDGKRVSWTMEYGKIVKNVGVPNKTVIGKMKGEIENSKEFLEALKKAKDKNLVCKVKPKITAQSKGIAGYKGVFATVEEAEASKKPICVLPARDGHVYEIRCNEVGRFVTRAENVVELSEISAGFQPALPPIPFGLFAQTLSFFRHFMETGHEAEAMVHAYWDKALREYKIVAPMQTVSQAYISVTVLPDESLDEERYIHVADIHSHNSMPAFFSGIDDADERATRIYIVVGRLDRPIPQIRARVSNGGRFLSIDPGLVMETMPPDISVDFPPEWTAAVHMAGYSHAKEKWQDDNFTEQCLNRLLRRMGGRPA